MEHAFATEDHPTLPRRMVAYVVDLAFVGVVSIVVFLAMTIASGGELHLETLGSFLMFAAVAVSWEVLWIAGPARGKPGQLLAGFRVVRPDGSRVSPGLAAFRGFVKAMSFYTFGAVHLVSAVMIATTPRRQAVHDLAASTVCVEQLALERSRDDARSPTADASPAHEVTVRREDATTEARRRGPFL